MKAGHKTTEFWVNLGFNIACALVLAFAPEQGETWIPLAAAALSNAGYAVSRGHTGQEILDKIRAVEFEFRNFLEDLKIPFLPNDIDDELYLDIEESVIEMSNWIDMGLLEGPTQATRIFKRKVHAKWGRTIDEMWKRGDSIFRLARPFIMPAINRNFRALMKRI